ncbi:MAG: trimeric intracellular cation channel family protein [Prevotella sp.]|nr:trimeric intracellular cation channel family protein [Prevotella sp.]MCD8288575.1 trimeric intracellular cation channel family protein [Prevotella sp.]MCD8305706.1 trimeric intracellular cation channel family protein [Prevotella sp.]
MIFDTPAISHTFMQVLEFLGTFAFAVSGIRQAAQRRFDWFGGFVCGVTVAIGGGTLRDLMLGVTPFWMTNALYLTTAIVAQVCVILFSKYLKYLDNTWFVFDTIGLALFTIVGIQKTLLCGHPFWVAIVMGCITGSAGGILRDLLLDTVPVLFRKDFYAMTCIVGGLFYWLLSALGIHTAINSVLTFFLICLLRYLAFKYHLGLPVLKGEDGEKKEPEK